MNTYFRNTGLGVSKLRIVSHSDTIIMQNYTDLNDWTQKCQTAQGEDYDICSGNKAEY